MNLTIKELSALQEQLRQEKLLIKKYRIYASHTQSGELKAKFNMVADKHQQHFNTMMGYLQ